MVRTNEQLSEAVMWRVQAIFIMRQFANPLIIESSVLLLGFSVCLFLVSIKDVWFNMLSLDFYEISGIFNYFYSAFSTTEITVKGLALIMLGAAVLLTKNLVKELFQFMPRIGRRNRVVVAG